MVNLLAYLILYLGILHIYSDSDVHSDIDNNRDIYSYSHSDSDVVSIEIVTLLGMVPVKKQTDHLVLSLLRHVVLIDHIIQHMTLFVKI